MANDLTPFQNKQIASAFTQGPVAGMGDMTEGVSAGFPVVSFKGKVWKIKHKGAEDMWLDDQGRAAPWIEAVIINASSNISKIWYKEQFAEGGEHGPPDCWSTNGIVPDAAAPHKPSPTCAGCPMNVFGTAKNGGKGKACGDGRRVAIVPWGNVLNKNEAFGGPMLLRIPPTSLSELATYQRKLGSMRFPYYAVATRISFDPNSAYPKMVFSAIEPLDEEEAKAVIEMATDDRTQRMLNDAVVSVSTNTDDEDPSSFFENGTKAAAMQQTAPTSPAPQPVAQGRPTPVQATAPVAPAPVAAAPAGNPLVATMRPLVEAGHITKEAYKLATGEDFDPPAPPAPKEEPWAPKPEHMAMVGLVKGGMMTPEVFAMAAGYPYKGPLPNGGAASPASSTATVAEASPAAGPTTDAAPKIAKRTRKAKEEAPAQEAVAAPQETVEDATFTEPTAAAGGNDLDAALDGLFTT